MLWGGREGAGKCSKSAAHLPFLFVIWPVCAWEAMTSVTAEHAGDIKPH